MEKIIVTISCDDSCSENLKFLQLLNKYNLKGTFYLNKKSNSGPEEIVEISCRQEIGAHSLGHSDLIKLSLEKAKKEILGSKKWLEKIIGRPVKIFAYPFGYYNDKVKEAVKQAGFIGARTTEEFCFTRPDNFFQMGTTLHIYPFPLRKRNEREYHLSRFLFQPLSGKFLKILKLGLPLSSFLSWSDLAKNTFDFVLKNGGIYHLWGHAWEIEKFGLWPDLEKVLKYIAGSENVFYLTNSQVLENRENINSTR